MSGLVGYDVKTTYQISNLKKFVAVALPEVTPNKFVVVKLNQFLLLVPTISKKVEKHDTYGANSKLGATTWRKVTRFLQMTEKDGLLFLLSLLSTVVRVYMIFQIIPP